MYPLTSKPIPGVGGSSGRVAVTAKPWESAQCPPSRGYRQKTRDRDRDRNRDRDRDRDANTHTHAHTYTNTHTRTHARTHTHTKNNQYKE